MPCGCSISCSRAGSDRQKTLGEEFQLPFRALLMQLPAGKPAPAEGNAEIVDEARFVALAVERGIRRGVRQLHAVAVVELLVLDGEAGLGRGVPAEHRIHDAAIALLASFEPAFDLDHEM